MGFQLKLYDDIKYWTWPNEKQLIIHFIEQTDSDFSEKVKTVAEYREKEIQKRQKYKTIFSR